MTVSWSNPAPIVYGTLLGATQLNATTSTAGSFVYSPPAGTLLMAGLNQALSVAFTPNDTANHRSWQPNGNLEQVSDWLTKILLGVGLTQLTTLPQQIQSAGEYVAEGIGPGASGAVGTTILIAFAVGGFVIGFLVTRFDIGKAINREDGVLSGMASAALRDPGNRSTVEALVSAALYSKPGDLDPAIQAAETYFRSPEHEEPNEPKSDADLRGYLACAYAQKYRYERDVNHSDTTILRSLREKALFNLQRAVALDRDSAGKYRALANPPAGSEEDDLAVFGNDPEFMNALKP